MASRPQRAARTGEHSRLLQLTWPELLDAAMPIGQRKYAEKPKAFKARWKQYWLAAAPGG
jgi:hypothetical protein